MNRRELIIAGTMLAGQSSLGLGLTENNVESVSPVPPGSPPTILLNDYLPQSIYRIPVTEVAKAKFPIIDAHCHGRGPLATSEMLRIMDKVGVEKTVVFTGAASAERFSEIAHDYVGYPNRFDLWCMFDLRGVEQPGFGPNAIKSLEECNRAGAKGVGELHDKGRGIFSPEYAEAHHHANASKAPRRTSQSELNGGPAFTANPKPPILNAPIGPHPDDPRLDILWDKAGKLGMPISIHVSDPIWSYQPMNYTNDGLMNGWSWRIVLEPGTLDNDQLVNSLENTVKKHPKTQFIACHLSNLDYDLTRLGQMFDRNLNLYADIAARFAETATIPRVVHRFLVKYSDRIVYGTDVTYNEPFFGTTFRILESDDDHFYMRGKVESANFNFNYHWPLNGFGLPDEVLKNIYHDNAERIFSRAQQDRT